MYSSGNLLAVFLRGDQGVAVRAWVAVEEDEGSFAFVDDVLGEQDVTVHHPAYEAGFGPEAAMHGLHVRMEASEAFFHLCLAGLRGIKIQFTLPVEGRHHRWHETAEHVPTSRSPSRP